MVSYFFYVVVGVGLLLWFASKNFMAGLLPIIIYLFIRLAINLMLIFTGSGDRP